MDMGTLLSDVSFLVKSSNADLHTVSHYIRPISNLNFLPKQKLLLPEPVSDHYFFPSSCNGLLFFDDFIDTHVIWNPSTGVHKVLDSTSLVSDTAADSSSSFCSGFGFDPRSEDYKVVRLFQNWFDNSEVTYQAELYSLKSDSWKPISYSIPNRARPFFNPSTHINGVYYWYAMDTSNANFIISFDFANEEFSSIPLPEYPSWKKYTFDLLEFDGLLAAVVYPINLISSISAVCPISEIPLDIWVYNGEWIKKFVTQPLPVKSALGFSKNGEQMFVEGSNHQLLLYECATKNLVETGIHHTDKSGMLLLPYVQNSEIFAKTKIRKRNLSSINLHKKVEENVASATELALFGKDHATLFSM